MKARGKIIVGIGFVLIALIAGTVFYQMNKTDEGNFAYSNRTDTNQVTEKENDDPSDSNNSSKDQTEKDKNQNTPSAADQITEEEVLPGSQSQENQNQENQNQENQNQVNPTQERPVQSPAATETEVVEPAAPAESPSTGLHFSSREEAIQFGFSRFTAEEIAIYNRVSENGLTPEQQEMAIQMAYSRFTSEEIAALEEVLGQ